MATVRRTTALTPEAAPLFFELWDRIKHQSRYRVHYDSADLIRLAVTELRDFRRVPPTTRPQLRSEAAPLEMSTATGITAKRRGAGTSRAGAVSFAIPDVYAYLQQRVDLTRPTIFEVLKQSERYGELEINPQLFLDQMVAVLRRCLGPLLVAGVQYEPLPGQDFSLELFEQDEAPAFLNQLFVVQQHPKKALFDYVAVNNALESAFARDLEADERVRFFMRLPAGFQVPTPVGSFVPTWAVLLAGTAGVCLVAHPAASEVEKLKMDCARRHFQLFAVQGVRFAVATTVAELVIAAP